MSSIVVDRRIKRGFLRCRQGTTTMQMLKLRFALLGKMFGIALLILLDTTSRVNKLLLAGKKRMAGGADLDFHLVHNRSHLYFISARAHCSDFMIFRVDTFFHNSYTSNSPHGGDDQFRYLLPTNSKHKRDILLKLRFFSTINRSLTTASAVH